MGRMWGPWGGWGVCGAATSLPETLEEEGAPPLQYGQGSDLVCRRKPPTHGQGQTGEWQEDAIPGLGHTKAAGSGELPSRSGSWHSIPAACPSWFPKPGRFLEPEFRCLKTLWAVGGRRGQAFLPEAFLSGGLFLDWLEEGVRQGLQRPGGVGDCGVPLRAGTRATPVNGPESRYLQLWGPCVSVACLQPARRVGTGNKL